MFPLSRVFLVRVAAMAGTSCTSTLGLPVRVTERDLMDRVVVRPILEEATVERGEGQEP